MTIYKIKRFSSYSNKLEQREFIGALSMINQNRNPQRFDQKMLELPLEFRNSLIGGRNLRVLRNALDRERNSSLGARTISQVYNIAKKHETRLTSRRHDIIQAAIKNREEASQTARNCWRYGHTSIDPIKSTINNPIKEGPITATKQRDLSGSLLRTINNQINPPLSR
jgi:hypothetical protein